MIPLCFEGSVESSKRYRPSCVHHFAELSVSHIYSSLLPRTFHGEELVNIFRNATGEVRTLTNGGGNRRRHLVIVIDER
jgi:hypothetical protein